MAHATRAARLEELAARLELNAREELRWERGRLAALERDDSSWAASCVVQLARLRRHRERLLHQVERLRSERSLF